MKSRIVEIADDSRHLHCYRGFLIVKSKGEHPQEIGRVPLDDIVAVITHAHGLSYTNNLLVELSERGIPFVLCASNHTPTGILWPVEGHHQQALRYDAQIAAKKPIKKRLWAQLVKAKLQQQAATLLANQLPHIPLTALVEKVKSGDPGNIEAQGAQRYWPLLFDKAFRRDQSAGGTNAQLNYGYALLRSATARAVIAAGLHPTLGLHHSNQYNPMRLVDDLMEPYRPYIDFLVHRLSMAGLEGVTAESKKIMAQCLYIDLTAGDVRTPLFVCVQNLATSLAQVFTGDKTSLELHDPTSGYEELRTIF